MNNRGARKDLEKIFGKICMIEVLGIRKIPVEERRKIKGYKKYDDQLTYHHLKTKSSGGEATIENGALLKGYNHQWLHTLPSEQIDKINKAIIEFKGSIMQISDEGLVIVDSTSISIPGIDISNCIEIPAFDNTQADLEKRKKFNRAKIKQETRRRIINELNEVDNYDEYER